jgi:glycosyltransferase involved in cell wall biosynthesis
MSSVIQHTNTKTETSSQIGLKTVVVIIPAYNEAKAIGQVVLAMHRYASTVLVVDDGSSDNTAAIAQAAGATVIRHQHNQGKGAALRTGFEAARHLNPDAVVTIDADGQHRPEETPRLLAPILSGRADLVVGSRYLKPTSRVPFHRVWGHHLFKFLINQISGVPITDTQSGFRAFSPRALQAVAFRANGFAVESEMQFQAYKFKLRVTEVPITVHYSKETIKRSAYWQGVMVLTGVLRLAVYYRPVMVYSTLGLWLLLINLAWAAWSSALYLPASHAYLSVTSPFVLVSMGIFLTSLTLRSGPPLVRMPSSEPEPQRS